MCYAYYAAIAQLVERIHGKDEVTGSNPVRGSKSYVNTRTVAVKRLYKSRTDKLLEGVCGGIAEYFAIDPTIVRLAVVVLTVLTGFIPLIIAYVICAIIIPVSPK